MVDTDTTEAWQRALAQTGINVGKVQVGTAELEAKNRTRGSSQDSIWTGEEACCIHKGETEHEKDISLKL